MIQNKICLIAESVIRDAETNQISIYNIIDEITAQGFPLFIQKLQFFAIWEREVSDPAKYNAQVIITLDNEQLISQELNPDFQNKLRNRSIITISPLVLPQPGDLSFCMKINDGPEATYKIHVQAVESTIQPSEESST